MRFYLIAIGAFAAVLDIFVTKDFDIKSIQINELDSIVFQIKEGNHEIIQVTSKDDCTHGSIDSGKLEQGQNYLIQFKKPGVYFFASKDQCSKGFRTVIEVIPTPINLYAKAFKQAEAQMLQLKIAEQKQTSSAFRALPLVSLLILFI